MIDLEITERRKKTQSVGVFGVVIDGEPVANPGTGRPTPITPCVEMTRSLQG